MNTPAPILAQTPRASVSTTQLPQMALRCQRQPSPEVGLQNPGVHLLLAARGNQEKTEARQDVRKLGSGGTFVWGHLLCAELSES